MSVYGDIFRGRVRSEAHHYWMADRVPYLKLPEPWVSAADTDVLVREIRLHRDLHESALGAFERVASEIGMDALQAANMDRIEQSYCHRKRRRAWPEEWSVHALGIAIDFNPALAPLNGWSRYEEHLVDIWREAGWQCHRDLSLHVQACHGH